MRETNRFGEKKEKLNTFCFVYPGRGNHGAREGVPEGMFRLMPTDSRCRRDAEAWATENLGFIGREENRAGRTELMPRFTEACVESGSGLDLLSATLNVS